jgi:hypothetical protein
MIRWLTSIGALALLLVPSALAAPAPNASDRANAQRDCRALQDSMTAATFRATYGRPAGARNAFGKCVSQWSREEAENRVNAARACRAERGTTPESKAAFTQKYGGGKNAFGRCVSSLRRSERAADREATLNAAQECKAERGTTPESRAAFNTKYGGARNAFGKCVSTLARAQDDA